MPKLQPALRPKHTPDDYFATHETRIAADRESARSPRAAGRGGKASGVIEERPLPVVIDLHAPTELGTARNGAHKPGVRGLGADEILRRDDLAMRPDNSKPSHTVWVSLLVGIQSQVMPADKCYKENSKRRLINSAADKLDVTDSAIPLTHPRPCSARPRASLRIPRISSLCRTALAPGRSIAGAEYPV
jgi:hypothetical protein